MKKYSFVVLGCKSEARAIIHSLKSSNQQVLAWYTPRKYAEHEQKTDEIFAKFANLNIEYDWPGLELKLKKHSNLIILLSNFRIINVSLLSPDILCFNLHNSKLPDYKGVHPIPWQIRDGATSIWISLHIASIEVDSGPVILRSRVKRVICDDLVSITKKIDAETYRLVRILAHMINSQKFDIHHFVQRRKFQPHLGNLQRPWARRLFEDDNIYNPIDSNTFKDFIDATPYPYNTDHE